MPCTTARNLTPTARQLQQAAIARLQAALGAGTVTAVVSASGAVAFRGAAWQSNTGGVSDLCAYRALASANSPELRRALARAEAVAGRQVDARQVAAGTHSHDGGHSWHPGH